jgi:hypothetical protein
MAQVADVLLGTLRSPSQKVVYFMSLDNVKFRRPVKPGDQLRFELDRSSIRGRCARCAASPKVDGEVVASEHGRDGPRPMTAASAARRSTHAIVPDAVIGEARRWSGVGVSSADACESATAACSPRARRSSATSRSARA